MIGRLSSSEQWRISIILFGLWLFATAFNFDKAYHVDDTAYLEMARWIAQHPLHPMSGLLSWGADFEAIHYTNQPPLYFYLMAVWGLLFGWSEIAMHTLMSLFTFWAIVSFYRLAKIVKPDAAILPTAIFALSPAFVISQNTMVDIPLIALWLEFFRVLLEPKPSERWRYFLAGCICSLALLIKYSSLVLLPALVLHILLAGGAARLIWLMLPIGVLAAWSGFNYWDYGGIHIAGRPMASKSPLYYFNSALDWVGILGAISPFAGLYFYAQKCISVSRLERNIWMVVLCSICGAYIFLFLWIILFPARHMVNVVLQGMFLFTGVALLYILLAQAIHKIVNRKLDKTESILLCWIVTGAGFVVVLAPFMAARHVLLVLPPILLLLNEWLLVRIKNVFAYSAALFMTILLTGLLASADRWYAEIYRAEAVAIRAELPMDVNVWFNGNWGWQWYAEQAGMKMYSNLPERASPAVGDYFVKAENVCCALPLPESLKLEPIKTIVIERATRIQRFASISFYAANLQAWGYSYDPIEKFQIYKVLN